MVFDIKKMPYIIAQMQQIKAKNSYSDATLTADLNSFAGRNWDENMLERIFAGTLRPSADAIEVFTKYLQQKFYDYNSS